MKYHFNGFPQVPQQGWPQQQWPQQQPWPQHVPQQPHHPRPHPRGGDTVNAFKTALFHATSQYSQDERVVSWFELGAALEQMKAGDGRITCDEARAAVAGPVYTEDGQPIQYGPGAIEIWQRYVPNCG